MNQISRSRIRRVAVSVLLSAQGALAEQYSFTVWSVEDGLAQSQVSSVVQDCGGYLWAGTLGGGLSRFDGLEFRNYRTFDGLAHDTVRVLLVDRRCRFWIGAGDTLGRFDGRRFETVTRVGETIRTLMEDRRGRIWLGTESGLGWLDGRSFKRLAPPEGLNATVEAVIEDGAGRLWLGTAEGIRILDGEGLAALPVPPGAPRGAVYALAEDAARNLWIGTDGGVLRYDGKTFSAQALPGEAAPVEVIFVASSGHVWLGTEGQGAYRYDGRRWTWFTESTGLPSPTVWALAEDREEQIWLGTYRGGLVRFAGERFVHYTAADGLGDDVVRTILKNRRDQLVFGTFRGGVAFYDGSTFTRLTRADGLAHDFVLTALEDRRGDLWLGTFGGLSRWDGRRFENFPVDLVGDPVIRALLEDRNGSLWIGTNQGGVAIYDGESDPLRPRGRRAEPGRAAGPHHWGAAFPRGAGSRPLRAGGDVGFGPARGPGAAPPPEPHDVRLHRHRFALTRAGELPRPPERIRSGLDRLLAKDVVPGHGRLGPAGGAVRGPSPAAFEPPAPGGGVRRAGGSPYGARRAPEGRAGAEKLRARELHLSRAGQVIAKRVEVALAELAEEAVRIVRGALRERGVEVEVSSSETLFCDRPRTVQVLQNLLENAVKFMGDEPRPSIRIGSRREGSETVFFVEDNGQGIDPADQEKAFGLFQRADAGVEGAGVGLALVKKIIDTHGGRVWIESEGRGRGTRVLFTVPEPGGGRDE